MNNAADVLIPITIFASLFGILYVFFQTRHRERVLMIEKGADPSIFKHSFSKYHTIRLGMFLVGIALGILLGNILAETTRLKEEVAYFSMIFLCSGASLILYHVLFGNKQSE